VSSEYVIITPPSGEVLTLATIKAFLRIDVLDTSEDTLIELFRDGAVNFFEKYTSTVLRETVFETTKTVIYFERVIKLARSPITSINSVEIKESGSFAATTEYEEVLRAYPFITLSKNLTPDIDDNYFEVKIQFTAGLSEIPPSIQVGLLNHIGFLYENRGDCSGCSTPPKSITDMYNQYKLLV
jgi:uncharacterized phiE125 gp8 family phage protein